MITLIQPNLMLLPTCKGLEQIDIRSIVRVEAISNYSKLYLSNGKTIVVAKVLRCFEMILLASEFIRVHRTHLVNTKFIQCYLNGDIIQLANGDRVHVSRRKKSSVVQTLYNRAA